ncbi:DNA ligase 3 [Amyelois transitella]|uniref:DNA ligase 3 n=1 Tax=Amyelois transitella TaxID=680683 RepID=UPI00298FD152|nr:DNA ligase 3 [Amyelois transitella]XP_060802014.1 DNA ligase 3 [Amyelois transitella]
MPCFVVKMADFTPFYVDRAKGGRASCKLCKTNCPGGELRLAKIVASPYGDNQQMKSWYHVPCFMNMLLKQRPTTKRIDSIEDIGNWDTLSKEDQEKLIKEINTMEKLYADKNSGKYTAKVLKNECKVKTNSTDTKVVKEKDKEKTTHIQTDDNKFSTFCTVCKNISKVDAYTDKTATVNNFFTNGTDRQSFKGDLGLWCKLLMPQMSKRVYNLKSKQLVKLFSKIFGTDHEDMLTDLEQGDVAKTIRTFFLKSKYVQPSKESSLTIQDIEDFLEELSKLTKEEEQIYHFKKIVKLCTEKDITMLIRLIKGDLRINAGPKHILEGVHPDAYNVYQTSRDLDIILDRVLNKGTGVKHKDATHDSVLAKIVLMTPVRPMLAEACKSVEMAMKKCPNGMYSEIKYDGERVQVHKKGDDFRYFSRALKPVMPHKVSHFRDYLPKAFPEAVDLILDAEVLMIDVNTGKPLPFGTLGVHKQSEFKDAQVCLFVFDILYYNGKVLLDVPIRKRRQLLEEHMTEVKNHVMLSEQKLIRKPADLAKMIAEVLQLGLEGLVLKDLESLYEPGKRHWLKVKKDYLFDGAMADTADLVVLGAWFGTGKKGGMMSVFLMGCYDSRRKKWLTVTKVHTGHDDSTLDRLQKELSPLMEKISQDYNKLPHWLECNKGMVPDFVAKDPRKQPVWEITGTELTKANIHTAGGISVRFPRVTRIRDDKCWETATNFEELQKLFNTSKEKTDVSLLNKLAADGTGDTESPKIKTKSPKEKIDRNVEAKGKNDLNSTNSSDESNSSNMSVDETDTKITKSPMDSKQGKIGNSSKNLYNKNNVKSPMKIKESDKISKTNTIQSFFKKTESPIKRKHNDISDNDDDNKMEDTQKTKKVRIQHYPENPLPSPFKNICIGFYPDFISFPEDERNHFERHWIAYGGTVDKSVRNMDVDYVVHNSNVIKLKKMQKLKCKVPQEARHVSKNWLQRCIEEVKLCNPNWFPVYVEP